ncbi:MAG: dihydroorotate dehydrogenase-like protein [Fidelibacterota bacterium]
MNLKTNYLGLELANPIIVSSCGLSKTIEGIKDIEKAGAGAVVLKSMFEEQIQAETNETTKYVGVDSHTEAYDYLRNYSNEYSVSAYLDLVEKAKREVAIPVIASLNCYSPEGWTDYAKKLEESGADALELNIGFLNSDINKNSQEVEALYFEMVKKVLKKVNIPVAVKLGPYFSSLAYFSSRLVTLGVRGLVLFNRFYRIDFDIDNFKYASGSPFSRPEEISLPLQWIASLSSSIRCDFSGSTGVHDGPGVVKMLLAGAHSVQVCSTLYKNKLDKIGEMKVYLSEWMENNNFTNIDSFRGKLSREESGEAEKLDRLQYIKALTGIE